MTNSVNKGAVLMGTLAAFGITAGAMADPVVPGYTVERYACWDDPAGSPWELAFAPTGDLYVGRDDGGGGTLKILRFAAGGTGTECLPVETYEYGLNGIADPDAVVFDAVGAFSAPEFLPSVLVGTGASGDPGRIWSIDPNVPHEESILWEGSPIANPHKMDIDSTGRLLISDEGAGIYGSSDGSHPVLCVSGSYSGIAGDTLSNRFFARTGGTIHTFELCPGPPEDPPFATGLQQPSTSDLAVGVGGVWGADIYTVSGGQLLRLDRVSGAVADIGSGFESAVDLEFGPDGALYVSTQADTIFRIVPNFPVPTVSTWGMIALALLVLVAGTVVFRRAAMA